MATSRPVIGSPNGTGGITNEWDVYYWNQANGNDKNSPTGGNTPYNHPGGVSGYNASMKPSGNSDTLNAISGNNSEIADRIKGLYGSSIDNIGQESTNYANMLKGNLNKNVAKADQYNQQAGQQRGLDNARAGLSGVDTSAMNEQGRRNASFGAAAINEDAQRGALDLYGQSISNRITGANTISSQQQALDLAKIQQPVAQAGQGGILSSIFGGLF